VESTLRTPFNDPRCAPMLPRSEEFKSPLGHDIFPHPCVVSTDEAQSAGRDAGTVIDAIEDRAERWHYRA
jgi:hypothetical protein